MNINGIYAGSYASESIAVDQKESQTSSSAYEAGQVLEGIVSKVSDKVTINFSGNEISFPKESVQNAREGEIRKYQIMDVSGTSLVLKEIGTTQETARSSAMSLPVNVTDTKVVKECTDAEEEEEQKDEESLSNVASGMTSGDYSSLREEGMTIEKFNLERLDRALERIKLQKNVRESSVSSQVSELKEKKKKIQETAENAGTAMQAGMTAQIAQRLEEADLPVTDENISRIANAMNLAGEAASMTDASFSYLIDNQLRPTIENVYKAVHAGSSVQTSITEEVWNSLKEDAAGILTDAGMQVTEESMQDARWLVEEGLLLTPENLQYKQTLQTIKDGVDQTDLLDRTVKAMQAKQKPETAEFIQAAETETQISVNGGIEAIIARRKLEETRLVMASDSQAMAEDAGIETNIKELSDLVEGLKEKENTYYQNLMKEAGMPATEQSLDLLKNTTEAMAVLQTVPEYVLGSTLQTQDTETIRSLAEEGTSLAAKLTQAETSYEALMTKPRSDMGDSIKKAFSGIDEQLQSLNLETTQANERAVRILGYNQIPLTQENITNIKLYDAKVNELIQNLKPSVTVELIRQGTNPLELSIDELNTTVKSLLSETGASEEEKYSEYLVNLDNKKELTQEERTSYIGIYRLLNNVEKTDGAAIGATVKAGREVTLANLLTAVRTIKKGSMDVSIDETFGGIDELTFSKKTITSQVQAAFSGNTAETTDGNKTASTAADQRNVLTGKDGNNSAGNQVNDSAGNTANLTAGTVSESSVDIQTEYQELLLNQILSSITPNGVSDLLSKNPDAWEDTTLEAMKEQMRDTKAENQDNAWQEEKLASIRTLAKSSQEEITFLQNVGIDRTVNNLVAAKDLRKGNSWFTSLMDTADSKNIDTEQLNDQTDLTDFIDDPKQLNNACEQMENSARDLMNEIYEDFSLDAETIQKLQNIQAGLELGAALRQKEYYEIPLETEDGITNMNLTVVHDTKDAGKISVTMKLSSLGSVQAEAKISDDTSDFTISVDSRAGRDTLLGSKEELEASLEEIGVTNCKINYMVESGSMESFIFRNGDIYIQRDEEAGSSTVREQSESSAAAAEDITGTEQGSEVTTDLLYKAAKVLVMYFQKNDSDAAANIKQSIAG